MLDKVYEKGDNAATMRLGNAHGRLRRFRKHFECRCLKSGEDRALVVCHAAQTVRLTAASTLMMIHNRHRSLGGAGMAVRVGEKFGSTGGDK